MTVLFADVVHSMDIAAAVGAERLREIMADLADRCAAVVQRYGGTVNQFTGDGIMAVFGAPIALEDHAVRACLAALGIQDEAKRLAVEVQDRDGIDLRLRVGLNSGQVIAGEIGSSAWGYTAVGEQVGLAQRMESVAPPGGVMLSASTARLVDGGAALGEPELVRIKGAEDRWPPIGCWVLENGITLSGVLSRLWSVGGGRCRPLRACWTVPSTATARWSASLVHLASARAVWCARSRRSRGVVAWTCSPRSASHTPAKSRSMPSRGCCARRFGVEGLDGQSARDRAHDRVPEADPEDLALFDDLLGIADPDVSLAAIDPDARRRRLTALVNAASLARESPVVYVVEDAHWIDEVSESMLAEFFSVIPQTPALMLFSYRPEYDGALTRMHGAQTIALASLRDSEIAALITELLGTDPSVRALGQTIADRAGGNPFFAEEIVRDLAERGVLRGDRGGYVSTADVGEVRVPATLQATIAARIDRLDPAAKRTLSAAAVIGSKFSRDLLEHWALILSWGTWWAANSSTRSDPPDSPSMCFTIH